MIARPLQRPSKAPRQPQTPPTTTTTARNRPTTILRSLAPLTTALRSGQRLTHPHLSSHRICNNCSNSSSRVSRITRHRCTRQTTRPSLWQLGLELAWEHRRHIISRPRRLHNLRRIPRPLARYRTPKGRRGRWDIRESHRVRHWGTRGCMDWSKARRRVMDSRRTRLTIRRRRAM